MFLKLFQGDCLKVMPAKIESQSIDFILTDPPFNVSLDYADTSDNLADIKYGEWCLKWFLEFKRILKLGHYGVVFSGDKKLYFVLKALYDSGLKFHHFLKWHKPGCQRVLSGTVFFGRVELALIFSNGHPDISLINRKKLFQDILVYKNASPRDKDAVNHEARRPIELYRQIIEGFTKEDDLILDCFLGTGTTFKACVNRNCIGIEISPKYCELIRKSCFFKQLLNEKIEYSFEIF